MSLMIRYVLVMALFIPFVVHSQIVSDSRFKFQMTGYYKVLGIESNDDYARPPNAFVLKWNEVDNKISGIYKDSYYSPNDESQVSGIVLSSGRTFSILFPSIRRGVRVVEILTPATGLSNGTVTSTITVKDSIGQPLAVYTEPLLLSAIPNAGGNVATLDNTEFSCVVGMGALTGYCGLYGGNITKASDNGGYCQFLINTAKLDVTNTGDFVFSMPPEARWSAIGYGEITTLKHYIGGLNANAPVSTTVNISRTQCDLLAGTNFPVGSCLTLRLVGTFSDFAGEKSFAGNYTISDQANNSCSYNLNLTRGQ